MKKQASNYQKNTLLDKYERAMENSLAKGSFVSVENLGATKKLFEETAKVYLELRKTKPITLRVNQEDLIKVKAKAQRAQIPYQKLVSSLIHQYAEGATELVI